MCAKIHQRCFRASAAIFFVAKATGDWRPVAFFPLSMFIQQTEFKMETVTSFLSSIRKGNFIASVYLKDAYFQISIHHTLEDLASFRKEWFTCSRHFALDCQLLFKCSISCSQHSVLGLTRGTCILCYLSSRLVIAQTTSFDS